MINKKLLVISVITLFSIFYYHSMSSYVSAFDMNYDCHSERLTIDIEESKGDPGESIDALLVYICNCIDELCRKFDLNEISFKGDSAERIEGFLTERSIDFDKNIFLGMTVKVEKIKEFNSKSASMYFQALPEEISEGRKIFKDLENKLGGNTEDWVYTSDDGKVLAIDIAIPPKFKCCFTLTLLEYICYGVNELCVEYPEVEKIDIRCYDSRSKKAQIIKNFLSENQIPFEDDCGELIIKIEELKTFCSKVSGFWDIDIGRALFDDLRIRRDGESRIGDYVYNEESGEVDFASDESEDEEPGGVDLASDESEDEEPGGVDLAPFEESEEDDDGKNPIQKLAERKKGFVTMKEAYLIIDFHKIYGERYADKYLKEIMSYVASSNFKKEFPNITAVRFITGHGGFHVRQRHPSDFGIFREKVIDFFNVNGILLVSVEHRKHGVLAVEFENDGKLKKRPGIKPFFLTANHYRNIRCKHMPFLPDPYPTGFKYENSNHRITIRQNIGQNVGQNIGQNDIDLIRILHTYNGSLDNKKSFFNIKISDGDVTIKFNRKCSDDAENYNISNVCYHVFWAYKKRDLESGIINVFSIVIDNKKDRDCFCSRFKCDSQVRENDLPDVFWCENGNILNFCYFWDPD